MGLDPRWSPRSRQARAVTRRHRFDPDWVVAPAATLREWMDENGLNAITLAAACGPKALRPDAVQAVSAVLDRKPLTPKIAAILERGTFVSARFWLALEHNYRVGLAAGKKDTT